MTDILALDIATKTGWARGRVGEIPQSGSVRFGGLHDSPHEIFAQALAWISNFLEPKPRPDVLMIEALLPPDAMKGKTSKAVRDRLSGLHGIMKAVASLRGIGEIAEVSVGDVRAHFIFDRTARREIAKRETLLQCKALDWPAEDDNAADACAIWSYACALIDPKSALRVVPLFHRRSA